MIRHFAFGTSEPAVQVYEKSDVDDLLTAQAAQIATLAAAVAAAEAVAASAQATADAAAAAVAGKVTGVNGIASIWRGTLAEYDAITTKDPNTLYAEIAG